MLLRFGFLYSCFMIAAGSSLLAELPSEPVPTLATSPAAPTGIKPAPAEPSELKPIGSPGANGKKTSRSVPRQTASRESATLSSLQKKQQELTQLQQEIHRLKTELGLASQYQAEVLLAEISLSELQELNPEIQGDGDPLPVFQLLSQLQEHRTMPTPQFRALEHCLKMTGTMTVLSKPLLLLTENQQAVFFSGTEVRLPGGGPQLKQVTYQPSGTSCVMTVKSAESGQLTVDFRIEHSTPDEHQPSRADESCPPGMACRRFGSTWTIPAGQSILMGNQTRNEQGEPVCLLVALTLTPIDAPDVLVTPPVLQPVPEPEAAR